MEERTVVCGPHAEAKVSDRKDINGRFMVTCQACGVCAHHYDLQKAIENLRKCACNPGCKNCNALRHSHTKAPAVPLGGSCNDAYHVCPNDGIRWWQSNDHFHLWQVVTDDQEWETITSW
jgi:hypothetical protein